MFIIELREISCKDIARSSGPIMGAAIERDPYNRENQMNNVGVIGLGDMGSGLAKNLIAAGFTVRGCDLSEQRQADFAAMGGEIMPSAADVGAQSDAVFVMVMNGDQAKAVILGDGLVSTMKPGGVVLLTATIKSTEAREIGAALDGTGLDIIDSPVSGGFPGAQSGTLTMMAAGTDAALEKARPVMEAVGKTIHRVGDEAGMGQTVKACLQSVIGSIFSATFEASALAAKAGVKGQVLYDVISSSGAGCGVANTALSNIIDRQFVGTGSHIATMYKDLTIAMDMARELGVPLFTAGTAMQLFQAGKTKYPDGDNWIVTRVLEDIVGAELAR
jgi:3-hydroxyisobutyrate dehydrogenase-like beta-hydroxyacid dehydrogenase